MADQGLHEAFNDCIDRLAAGQSISDCLRIYPQYAALLRPMLEVGTLVERTQASSFEVSAAQMRVRARVSDHLRTPPPAQRSYGRWALLVASLLIALAAVLGAAENSLPGDTLYSIKRLSENARSAVIGEQFGGRRIDEIRVLMALKREADVDFTGKVEQIAGADWQVAGLAMQVGAATQGVQGVALGDTVQVSAHTTAQGDLVALSITVLEKGIAPTPTPSATPTATSTDTPTRTPTLMPTMQPTQIEPTSVVCTPTIPPGWVRYAVQPGDLVTLLAQKTGAAVAQLIAVNCLPETQMIIVGQTLFLPRLPVSPSGTPTQAPPASQPTAAPGQLSGQPTDDHGGNGGDDHGGDHGGGGGGSSGDGGGDSGGHGGGGTSGGPG